MANGSLAEKHLNLAVILLSSTTVTAIFYTLVVILYCLLFRLSYAQLRDDHGKIKRQTACTLAFATVLLICATLDVIAGNRVSQVIFINESTLPGDPLGPSAISSAKTFSDLNDIVNTVEDLLILGVLSWRVKVVWSGTRFVVPLTIVSLFLYLVNAGVAISYRVIVWKNTSTSLAAMLRAEEITFIMASVFSLASLVFMTLAIIARLVFIRRKHIRLMGTSDVAGQYLGIVAMLIESYALDTLWGIGSLISFGLKSAPTMNFFINPTTQVDILSIFLVIYRVLSGRAWTRQTEERLSTLRWASNRGGTTTTGTVDVRQRNTIPEEIPPVISCRDGV